MANFKPCNTLGAILDGAIVANLLFGILTLQVHFYYRRFPQDPRSLKIMVAVVWLLEVAHTISIGRGLYVAAIIERGQVQDIFPKSFRIGYFFGGTAGPVVQAFFVTRVAKCFEKPYMAILCWTMTFLRLLSNLWLSWVSMSSEPLAQFQARWQWLLTTGLILEASVDLLIATSLCYFLVKSRHHSVHKQTIRLLDKLIAVTIRTGLITSLISITVIVCFLTMPENTAWLAIMVCQAKVFSNTMLASLNGRPIPRYEQGFGDIQSKSSTFPRSSMEFTTNINLETLQISEGPDVQGDLAPTSSV